MPEGKKKKKRKKKKKKKRMKKKKSQIMNTWNTSVQVLRTEKHMFTIDYAIKNINK